MKKKLLRTIAVIFLAAVPVFGRITMKPYLMSVTDSSVWVLVECDSREKVRVEYGLALPLRQKAFTTITGSPKKGSYIHKVQLKGLRADTAYFYRATQEKSAYGPYLFRTVVSKGKKFTCAVFADTRNGNQVFREVTKAIQNRNARFVVSLGDVIAGPGDYTERWGPVYYQWKYDFFIRHTRNLLSTTPLYFSCGDHETYCDVTRAFTQVPAVSGIEQDSGFYSVDYGDLHLCVVNTYWMVEFEDQDLSGAQDRYFKSDLANCDAKWIVAVSEHPTYSVGYTGSWKMEEACDWNKHFRDMVIDVFEPAGVDMIISGNV